MSADVHSGQFQQIDFTRTESIGKILNKSICGGSVPSHRRGAVSDSLLQGILQANTPVNIYIGALIIKELFYTCVAKLVLYLHKNKQDAFVEEMEYYCDSNDFNKAFYYSNDFNMEEQLKSILTDADRLQEVCSGD